MLICPQTFFLDAEGLSIAPGVDHICVLERQPGVDIGGRPRCWGVNDYKKCDAPKDEIFVQIISAMYFSCGINLDQSVHCWGRLPDQHISGLYTQITGGKHYACGVLTDGNINCWGHLAGAIGRDIPSPDFMRNNNINKFVQVSCEDTHCCALDDNGHAFCWGEELVFGAMRTPEELANGSMEHEVAPDEGTDNADFYGFNEEESLPSSGGVNGDVAKIVLKQISVGYRFTCGIRYDNSNLLCWGHLDSLQYGASASEYLTFEGPFRQVASGVLGFCAIYEDGTKPVLCLGAAKSTMRKYAVEYDQIDVGTTMICGVNMDNSQLECSGVTRNIAAAMPPGLEVA